MGGQAWARSISWAGNGPYASSWLRGYLLYASQRLILISAKGELAVESGVAPGIFRRGTVFPTRGLNHGFRVL